MRIRKVLLYFITTVSFVTYNLFSTSIDGTSSPQYLTKNQVFHNTNDYARGFVKFKAGATILGDANAFFGIYDTFSGGLDLRETGTLSLEDNIYLDSNFTISGSGVIRGDNKTIFMSGNLTITDNAVIHINSDTIIDGQGNDLIFGKRSKLFVDTNITLTLQNMRLIQTFNNFSDACIRLAALGSKLSLKNVELALANDFLFNQGQLFIHGDVAVTGTSAFVYKSTQRSFIASDSTFYFDIGTTFSVAPATVTDCKFDQSPTTTGNSFILLENQTSKLKINEASFCMTPTGLKLTKGKIDFDNKCFIKTNSALDFARAYLEDLNLTAATERSPSYISYSPDGNYLAVVNKTSDSLQIFDSTTLAQIGSSASTGIGSAPVCVSWSSTSTQLAVANSGDNTIKIYNFDGANTPSFSVSNTTESTPSCCAWAIFGNYIAVTNVGSSSLQIFRAPTLYQIGSSATTEGAPSSVYWGPLSKFVAVTNSAANSLQIFSFDYMNTPTHLVSYTTGKIPSSVAWSANGLFLSVANNASNTLQTFLFDRYYAINPIGTSITDRGPSSTAWSFDGEYCGVTNYISDTIQFVPFSNNSGLAKVGSSVNTQIGTGYAGAWSADGNFIALANTTTGSLQVFSFNGSGTPSQVGSNLNVGTNPQSISWSPDGAFLAVADKTSSGILRVYSFDGVSTPSQVGSNVTTGNLPQSVTWSPDGSFIALVNQSSNTLQIFSFDGVSTPTQVGSDATTGNSPNSVAWSPDGNHLAVGSDDFQVFSFDGSSTPTQVGSSIISQTSLVYWTSDGNFINAVYGNWLKVYFFDGVNTPTQITDDAFIDGAESLTKDNRFSAKTGSSLGIFSINGTSSSIQTGGNVSLGFAFAKEWLSWSPNEKFIALAGRNFITGQGTLQIYSFTMEGGTDQISQSVSTKKSPSSFSWAPSSLNAAVVNNNSDLLQIFSVKFPSLFTQVGSTVNTDIPTFTGRDPYSVAWSPDGRFVAITSFLDGYLKVYSFDGINTPTEVAKVWTDYAGASVAWSPDGKFISVVNGGLVGFGGFRVFSFDGVNTLTQIGSAYSFSATSVSWSPDGRFIANVEGYGSSGKGFRIFSFDGISTPIQVGSTVNVDSDYLAWSPDGRFIVDQTFNELFVYSFDGTSTPTQIGATVPTADYPSYVEWSPDGRFIAISCARSSAFQIFEFDGTNTPFQVGFNVTTNTSSYDAEPLMIHWLTDGKFIVEATSFTQTFTPGKLQLYSFDGVFSPKKVGSPLSMGPYLNMFSLSPDGKYLALIDFQYNTLKMYKLNYIASRSPQALSNGLVLGDSDLGSTYDTSINVLAGSNVYIDGLVNYDCTI